MPADTLATLSPALQFTVWAVLILLVLGALALKGFALWRAANRGEKWWFIALLVVNTLGLLELFYLFVIAKNADKPENTEPPINRAPLAPVPAAPQAVTPPSGTMTQ